MAPDLTEARDLAAMWQARAEAAEAALDAARAKPSAFAFAFASVLRAICRADRTRYDHHEPRAWDGKRPKEDGGTIWLTPREKAESALRLIARNGDITAAEGDWRADDAAKVAP